MSPPGLRIIWVFPKGAPDGARHFLGHHPNFGAIGLAKVKDVLPMRILRGTP